MYKELLITILIIILIFTLDVITNNYTAKASNDLENSLKNLKSKIAKEEEQNAELEKIMQQWKKYNNVMQYYIEHDELEKVETELTKLKANIENKKYEDCSSEIDTTVFLLDHIEDKEKFTIQSIF